MSSSRMKNINSHKLKKIFRKSADVQLQDYSFNTYKVLLITCKGMIDTYLLNEVIVPRLQLLLNKLNEKPSEKLINDNLHVPALVKVNTQEEIISSVYTGHVVIYFEDLNMIFKSNIADKPNRNPEETKMELTIKGPKDNFIEDIDTNIALIRKRLPTNSLCVKTFELGRRTKTTVAVIYFDDIVNKDILNGIITKINEVDVDIVFSGDALMELIDKRSKLLPRHDYTGRPDFVMQSLARGRVCILVDGVAYAIITPINLYLLFKTAEDNEYPSIFSSFERLIRFFSILVGGLLPAFWLALVSFHQEQLPLKLLATVVKASTGLPFPAVVEMLLMLLAFELFREAGLRLPESVGGTLSVVGGLIIGDAAIRAGITSPVMIVIIAVSVISAYTLLNQSLGAAISILRVLSIVLTAFFGFFGFFIAYFFIIMHLANIRIFGVPYLNIGEDMSWGTIIKTLLRPPVTEYVKRPKALRTTDNTRGNDDEK